MHWHNQSGPRPQRRLQVLGRGAIFHFADTAEANKDSFRKRQHARNAMARARVDQDSPASVFDEERQITVILVGAEPGVTLKAAGQRVMKQSVEEKVAGPVLDLEGRDPEGAKSQLLSILRDTDLQGRNTPGSHQFGDGPRADDDRFRLSFGFWIWFGNRGGIERMIMVRVGCQDRSDRGSVTECSFDLLWIGTDRCEQGLSCAGAGEEPVDENAIAPVAEHQSGHAEVGDREWPWGVESSGAGSGTSAPFVFTVHGPAWAGDSYRPDNCKCDKKAFGQA
jgi:hypothetical protein